MVVQLEKYDPISKSYTLMQVVWSILQYQFTIGAPVGRTPDIACTDWGSIVIARKIELGPDLDESPDQDKGVPWLGEYVLLMKNQEILHKKQGDI